MAGETSPKQPSDRNLPLGPVRDVLGAVIPGEDRRALTDADRLTIQLLLDAMPFYVNLVDEGHNIILANQAMTEALGTTREEIRGQYCPNLVHGCDHPFPGCPLEAAVEQGRAVERELFDPKRGGWTRAAVYPTQYLTPDGQAVYLHTDRDITEDKKVESAIEQRSREQDALSTLAQIALLDTPIEEQMRLALEVLLGLPWLPVEPRGAVFLVAADQKDTLRMVANIGLSEALVGGCSCVPFGRCLCGQAAQSGEVVYAGGIDERHEVSYDGMTPHGHYAVPIRVEQEVVGVLNLYTEAGHARAEEETRFLSAAADIVAGVIKRKRGEMALSESEERFRSVTTSAHDAIIATDASGRVLLWNNGAERMFGYSAEEALDRKMHELIVPLRFRGQFISILSKMRSGELRPDQSVREATSVRADGAEIPLELSHSLTAFGGRWARVSVARDVSERRAILARLAQSQQLATIGTLTAAVAHEVNNPLAYMLGNLDFALENLGELEEDLKRARRSTRSLETMRVLQDLAEAITDAKEGGSRVRQIVRDLKTLSRIQTDENEPVDLNHAIETAVKISAPQVKRCAQVVTDFGKIPPILGHEARLGQVFINLLVNAAHAISIDGGPDNSIRLSTRLEGRIVIAEVSDTGGGIPAEERTELFEPFVTTKPAGEGTGLGLWICKNIIESAGGDIEFETTIGEGTRFIIRLPALLPDVTPE